MSLNILDSFNYQGKNQNFARDSFKTIADMVAYPETSLPDIFTATNEETGKQYIYNVNNTVDATLGKWRENSVSISADSTNAIAQKTDGIYVKEFTNRTDVLEKLTKDPTTGNLLFDGNTISGGGVSFDEWATGTAYVSGDYVVSGNKLYKCINDHTSTTDIDTDIANWELVIGDKLTLDSNGYLQLDSTDIKVNEAKTVDGKTIKEVTQLEYDNMITAGTEEENTVHIITNSNDSLDANLISTSGFGGVRCYNGKLQYYNVDLGSWVDVIATGDNTFVIQMYPQDMRSISGYVNYEKSCIDLLWQEPADTVLDNQLVCRVDGVKIVRKEGSAPTGPNDGNLVVDVKYRNFGRHKNVPYSDMSTTFTVGTMYYYGFFPYNSAGLVNVNSVNTIPISYKDYELYGFVFDTNESDPFSNITYIEDNENFESVYMDYNTGLFNYGSWNNAFFIKECKPCMLKYNGTVDYYLNPNDYTFKEDGIVSDIADSGYSGNVMVEFPLVYYKIVDNSDGTYNFYFSNKLVDSTFKPWWSFYDKNGNVINHTYMAAYSGSNVSSVLRSISGTTNMYNQTAATEISYANANNTNGGVNNIWDTELYCDRQLINMLLMLIGKSTDTQTVFGNGNIYYVSNQTTANLLTTGTMNQKGLFWGSNSTTSHIGVKVFGIENYWGNNHRRIRGLIIDNGTQKVKLTYGQQDGSTIDGYNTDGTGYITVAGATPSGTSGGYISKCIIGEYGIIPYETSGSASTYECDALWFNNSQVGYAFVGGDCSGGTMTCGIFAVGLNLMESFINWNIGTSISCKPIKS